MEDETMSDGTLYTDEEDDRSSRGTQRRSIIRSKPQPIHSPTSPMASTLPHNNLPSAPASPPTPAPSPSPHSRLPAWNTAGEHDEVFMRDIRGAFKDSSNAQKERILSELLNMCDSRQLSFVQSLVSPRLKKDPFTVLPNEICLRILSFVDHPKTLARSSQVSLRWHELVNDDMAWKSLCEKHAYRRMSSTSYGEFKSFRPSPSASQATFTLASQFDHNPPQSLFNPLIPNASNSAPDLSTSTLDGASNIKAGKRRDRNMSYRSHFKRKYQVETAWRNGGRMHSRYITPDQGVVTSLHLTDKYIVMALDNAKIHVFDADGAHQKTLHGHSMGVWAMVPWGDVLVSGGCDRDVRVWNMANGTNIHTLRGHTSTVRCLKMSDANTAITGSRDTTLRVWDITRGFCKHILIGHGASVRCLEVHGDLIASGSYDTSARIWSISEGKCLQILQGHFSQIYAIAFDGRRVATGSLDTSVRVWDPTNGKCLAVLQGHTSLVGQLQMRGNTLVTGGSDGSVRVWSLTKLVPIHRLAAHDNSVTSLQFNDSRIVSGGSDGRVKIWDVTTGAFIRELSAPAEAVWRVVFEEEKAVILANRGRRTIMEVWSFAPLEDDGPPLSGAIESETPRASSALAMLASGPTIQHRHSLAGYVLHDEPTMHEPLRYGKKIRQVMSQEKLAVDDGEDILMSDTLDSMDSGTYPGSSSPHTGQTSPTTAGPSRASRSSGGLRRKLLARPPSGSDAGA